MARMLTCLRAGLLGFVLLLGFSGLVVAVFSSYFLYRLHEHSLLTPPGVDGPPASLLCLGLLTLAMAWFIWHFDYSNRSQVISLAGLIILVALMEAGVGIWALVRQHQLDTMPVKVVQKAESTLFDSTFESVWHDMHIKMKCCGVYGNDIDFQTRQKSRPWSCCYHVESAEDKIICDRGCLVPMTLRTQSTFLFAFLLSLGSVILKTITVGLAWCYAKMVKEGMTKRKREMAMTNRLASEAAAAAAARSSSMLDHSANFSPLVEKSRMRI